MKHYIISDKQLAVVYLHGSLMGSGPLPELKRLSDEEIVDALHEVCAKEGGFKFYGFAHAIMDKIGVPK